MLKLLPLIALLLQTPSPTVMYYLEVRRIGTGTGTVTGAVDGKQIFSCGSVCQVKLLEDTRVVLRAIPSSNSHFVQWEGEDCRANPPQNFSRAEIMVEDVMCTARFGAGLQPTPPSGLGVKITKP